MRQLLMLGFYCEVYRREPLCRIYVNNVLADEFNIPHTPSKDKLSSENILDPAFCTIEQLKLESETPFLKYIELNDADTRSLDIRVEIQNDDNNYANGFMTKHTAVILSQCYLAPIKVWEDFQQIQNRWRFSLPNRRRCVGRTISIAQYYSGARNYVFDNFARYTDMHFPDIVQQPQSIQQLKANFSNYQHLPRMWRTRPNKYRTGASGYFHVTLAKKLGFWRHSTDRRRGWWKWSMIPNVKDLYDKYRSNEDTRSTDQ